MGHGFYALMFTDVWVALLYPLFPKSVRYPTVTFLVNISPPKPLDVATSNFVAE